MDGPTDIVAVVAVLTAARAIVADPARWGALGALDRVAAEADAAHNSIMKATALLNRAACEIPGSDPATLQVLDLNPSHTATLEIFDRAIRAAPKPETPRMVDILTIARTLIAHPDRWAQGAIALDRSGRALITFEGGCRFCAAGAVGLAAHVLSPDPTARRQLSATVDHVAELLDCAAYKLGDYESYIGLNEHDTHRRVVAMFDHALDMARADAAPNPRTT